MLKNKFRGTGVAIITPFNVDGSIDYASMEKHINFLITNKIEYIVLLGTTGESVTIAKNEKPELVAFTKRIINKRVPLVVGVGGNNTAEVIANLQSLDTSDVDAILSVVPYYNKPNQNGIFAHYDAIAQNCKQPIILYNVPGRTGVNMTAETVLKLAHKYEHIIAVKEASGNFEQITFILKDKPAHFSVISGDDGLAVPQISIGVDGIISVVGNVIPLQFSNMIRAALDGNFKEAAAIHDKILPFINSMFTDGSPAGPKAALSKLGIVKNVVRLPLVPVSESHYNKIVDLLVEISI